MFSLSSFAASFKAKKNEWRFPFFSFLTLIIIITDHLTRNAVISLLCDYSFF